MTEKTLPTPEYLRKRLRYEPETGKLFWKDCASMSNRWRGQYAGKEAFKSVCLGYHTGSIDDATFKAHRIAWAIHYGEWPNGPLDHKNGVRTDNQIENLRLATPQENMRNRAMSRNNTSGACGVSWSKNEKKWKVQIKVGGKMIHLGYFTSIDNAKAAREAASAHYGFSSRHGAAV